MLYLAHMKSKMHIPVVMFLLGAGVAMLGSYLALIGAGLKLMNVAESEDDSSWQTVDIAGVVTMEIPASCTFNSGAGTRYVVCPTDENPQPTPEFTVSTDGYTVNVNRWENLESPYWQRAIESMAVVQPLTHDITIRIEK